MHLEYLDIKRKTESSYNIFLYYRHIIESYVSDYYVENHWGKLPKSWQDNLRNISIDQIAELLDFKKRITKIILPLSLLCLRNLINDLAISRDQEFINSYIYKNEEFLKYFWKNVKLKKRHEIEKIAQVCYNSAIQCNCLYIVDIGSGLGHLSRMLSYGYGFKVCTFEANAVLVDLAKELDLKLERNLKSKSVDHRNSLPIIHINKQIQCDMDHKDFLKLVCEAFNENPTNFKFGIVGLHPCGNLGSTLLRFYNDCSNVAFINIASCCYMKLTLEPEVNTGFPLSNFCRHNHFILSYLACEIACHAIENYVEKLRKPQDYRKLKIHAYRAKLEEIILSIDSKLKHSAVCNVKYDESLSFEEYCNKTFQKLSISSSENFVPVSEELINHTWKDVVVFYSIRLLFAPLIETIILFDRLLYTENSNSDSEIIPLFDCTVSPRNHVLSARKKH